MHLATAPHAFIDKNAICYAMLCMYEYKKPLTNVDKDDNQWKVLNRTESY